MSLLAGRMAALGTENAFKLGEDIQRCLDRGMKVIKFNLGEPDSDSAAHINQVGKEQIDAGNSHYCDPSGILPFREAISSFIRETRGLEVPPSRIVVTPGAKPPISFTLMTYVNPGDEVIYPSPGLPDLRVVGEVRRCRRRCPCTSKRSGASHSVRRISLT